MRKFFICKGFEDKDVIMPKRGTKLSAGYDLASIEEVIIPPNTSKLISTGLKASMEDDEVLLIYPRSSLGKKKSLMLTNNVAVIDADYFSNKDNDGHIMINLYNFSNIEQKIEKGERFAQGIFTKYLITDDDVASTTTRNGGYGSTGLK